MRRLLGRVLRALAVLCGLVIVVGTGLAWRALGQRARGERRARMESSPQWKNGAFENPQPLRNDVLGSFRAMLEASPDASPHGPLPAERLDPALLATPPAGGLRVSWLGHASALVEIDGARVLTDPIFSERASPLSFLGPRRWYPPAIALDALPPIDAVVISHDHYDHLDMGTIVAMRDWRTVFLVPLGVGAHLAYWGIPESRIVELDWWESTRVGALEITCTPARHASGRAIFDKDSTLWAGWALRGAAHRVYFSGDTGLFPAMKQIGERLGPFDLSMVETGQYHRSWPDWHIGPEQAVTAHEWVRARAMLPIHWALFQLALHAWTEPVERVSLAAAARQVSLATPRPGQPFEPGHTRPSFVTERWWPSLPFQTAAQHPIVSSQVER